jgi:glutathione peroxidase
MTFFDQDKSMNSVVKKIVRLAVSAGLVAGLALVASTAEAAEAAPCPALLNHTAAKLQDDSPQNLCQFSGWVLLVVNTASKCGYTPQYEALETLHARYATRGLAVLGFPSNDFNQELQDNKSIADFCFNTYGVKFPMFAKTTVVGPGTHPFYAALAKASGDAPRWNFHKYLIDRSGKVVATFPSAVDPLDARVTSQIESLLGR